MAYPYLFEVLKNELPKVEDKVRFLNCGGCGFFAYYLSKELIEKNIEHEILWIGCDYGRDFPSNTTGKFYEILESNEEPTLHHFHEKDLSMSHVLIIIDGHYIDSSGVHASLEDTRWGSYDKFGTMNIEKLKSLITCEFGWNSMYNREQNPTISKHIKNSLKKVA